MKKHRPESTFPWEGIVSIYLSRLNRSKSDTENYVSVWIAFNSWMKGNFGTKMTDKDLVNATKKYESIMNTFHYLKLNDIDFTSALESFAGYEVINSKTSEVVRYQGTFDSLLDALYTIRSNIMHGTDLTTGMNNECHKLASEILYVLLHKQIFPNEVCTFPL
ncbi:MAG: hypothetical protein V3T06_03855 [Dehalococcoidia bacterium]